MMGVVVTFTVTEELDENARSRVVRRVMEAIKFATEGLIEDVHVTALPGLNASNAPGPHPK